MNCPAVLDKTGSRTEEIVHDLRPLSRWGEGACKDFKIQEGMDFTLNPLESKIGVQISNPKKPIHRPMVSCNKGRPKQYFLMEIIHLFRALKMILIVGKNDQRACIIHIFKSPLDVVLNRFKAFDFRLYFSKNFQHLTW